MSYGYSLNCWACKKKCRTFASVNPTKGRSRVRLRAAEFEKKQEKWK